MLDAGELNHLWGGGYTYLILLWIKVFHLWIVRGWEMLVSVLSAGRLLCPVLKMQPVSERIRSPAYEFHLPFLMLSSSMESLKHCAISQQGTFFDAPVLAVCVFYIVGWKWGSTPCSSKYGFSTGQKERKSVKTQYQPWLLLWQCSEKEPWVRVLSSAHVKTDLGGVDKENMEAAVMQTNLTGGFLNSEHQTQVWKRIHGNITSWWRKERESPFSVKETKCWSNFLAYLGLS